jgi:hypothetical protein
MARARRATRGYALLELSPAAYDEIERKLLAAGYDYAFEAGPGSAINMAYIAGIVREALPDEEPSYEEAVRLTKVLTQKQFPHDAPTMSVAEASAIVANPRYEPDGAVYCFMCDCMVMEPCSRENCLHAANQLAAKVP